jgi:hypothetical protein
MQAPVNVIIDRNSQTYMLDTWDHNVNHLRKLVNDLGMVNTLRTLLLKLSSCANVLRTQVF